MPRYKVLNVRNEPAHGGDASFRWPLPTADDPGEWVEVSGPIECCKRGLHLTEEPMRWPIVGMRVYEAEGGGDHSPAPPDETADPSKIAFRRARLLREVPEVVPAYWRSVESFVRDEIPSVRWLRPDGDPLPEWLLVEKPTWGAAGGAARGAAGGAAGDAQLLCLTRVCGDLTIAPEHVAHAEARWRVWQKGWALLCDIDGRLVVYGATGENRG